jgi:hypothetical protein
MSETLIQSMFGLPMLLKGEFSSLTLGFNDQHACNYVDAKTYERDFGDDAWCGDWVSETEHQKALETNSVWCLHWYPNTPVGFTALLASDLGVLLTAAFAESDGSMSLTSVPGQELPQGEGTPRPAEQ